MSCWTTVERIYGITTLDMFNSSLTTRIANNMSNNFQIELTSMSFEVLSQFALYTWWNLDKLTLCMRTNGQYMLCQITQAVRCDT